MSEVRNQGGAERCSGAQNPEELHREFFEEALDGMLATDIHGRFILVNRRATVLTGYSREELLRLTIADLVNPADLARDAIRQAGRDLRLRMVEARSRCFLSRMPALRSVGGRPADRPRPLPLYGLPARGHRRARACDIGFSIFDRSAIVNPQSSLAPATSPGGS